MRIVKGEALGLESGRIAEEVLDAGVGSELDEKLSAVAVTVT